MSSPHILIVEDEAIVAMDIERSLGRLGYAVSIAHSGPEALAGPETKRPDLALMDKRARP
jgi:CheY-like chemotaxis protein